MNWNTCLTTQAKGILMMNQDTTSHDRHLTIREVTYQLEDDAKGKMAVFIYQGPDDPTPLLDSIVSEYVDKKGYHELVDSGYNNPWMRVILSNINEMREEVYHKGKHKL
jgi:hypothetical protein